jgi:SagB-type dehydrogenase family enzyme
MDTRPAEKKDVVQLPAPRFDSDMSVESALRIRRSVREFREEALTQQALGQLVWAAQGVTNTEGLRTAPSAGALYPLEVDVVVGHVQQLAPGVYRYRPDTHTLVHRKDGDLRKALARAALRQEAVREAAVVLVISAVYERTTRKYDKRGRRYVYMEVGHAAQNVFLQAVALGLGSVAVGAFEDADVARVLDLHRDEHPLYLLPIGFSSKTNDQPEAG